MKVAVILLLSRSEVFGVWGGARAGGRQLTKRHKGREEEGERGRGGEEERVSVLDTWGARNRVSKIFLVTQPEIF
ncbi:hypothetical protein QT986_11100, partial [Microcoleus sp. herbarium14]